MCKLLGANLRTHNTTSLMSFKHLLRFLCRQRQDNGESRSYALKSNERDVPMHRLYCFLDKGQSKTSSRTLCGEVGLEDLWYYIGRYTHTIVFDDDLHFFMVKMFNQNTDQMFLSTNRSFDGVFDQVIECPQQLVPVTQNIYIFVIGIIDDLNVGVMIVVIDVS